MYQNDVPKAWGIKLENAAITGPVALREKLGATPPATSRHTNPPLWLLPSRPDQVHGLSLREDQWSHHNVTT